MVRGKGIYVYDESNQKYIDCIAGYSALNQGHCHPSIIKAGKKQMNKLTLTSRAYHNDKMGEFCEKLAKTFRYDKVLLMNGGVESGENTQLKLPEVGIRKKGFLKMKRRMYFSIIIFGVDLLLLVLLLMIHHVTTILVLLFQILIY